MTAAAPQPRFHPSEGRHKRHGRRPVPGGGGEDSCRGQEQGMLSAQQASAPASSHFVILTARPGSISHRRTAGFSPFLFLGAL